MSRYECVNYKEYGKENSKVMVLLHGGGLSWWNYREVAEKLQAVYRVILPVLDGHAGSDRDFTSLESNAEDIIRFIDEKCGGSVFLIGGLSLGGQILLEILAKRKDICKYAIVESALVIPSKLTHDMIKPAFGSCYGLIHYRWFAKLQFRSLRIKQDLFEDYFRDSCKISKENMITFLRENAVYSLKGSVAESDAKIHIFVGEKENLAMRKSAAVIHERLDGSVLHVLPQMYHGGFSLNHPDGYVDEILKIVGKR